MRKGIVVLACSVVIMLAASAATAADFEWLRELNIRAQADPSGFKAQLAARFRIGEAQVTAVLGNVARPADAYMVLRLGEMSGQPVERVIDRYGTGKGEGWGGLAKSLGVKPGSPGFATVRIEPHLGTLDTLDATLPHPKGPISVSYRRAQGALSATVTLPPGLTGAFAWHGLERKLVPGEQSFRLQ